MIHCFHFCTIKKQKKERRNIHPPCSIRSRIVVMLMDNLGILSSNLGKEKRTFQPLMMYVHGATSTVLP